MKNDIDWKNDNENNERNKNVKITWRRYTWKYQAIFENNAYNDEGDYHW